MQKNDTPQFNRLNGMLLFGPARGGWEFKPKIRAECFEDISLVARCINKNGRHLMKVKGAGHCEGATPGFTHWRKENEVDS